MTTFPLHNVFIFGGTENTRYGETFFFTKSCIASIHVLCYTMIIFVFFK